MPDYIFKTYIDSGREYYEYTDVTDREQTIKKDFPFPESLMDLLYMDTQELEAITKKMDKALLAFYQSGAKDDLQVVAAGLDELASRHVYFELLRLDWTERLNAAERVTPKEYLRLLPHKKISHIYSNIDTMQRQIISLIAHALDMDGEKKSVSEKMVAYRCYPEGWTYERLGPDGMIALIFWGYYSYGIYDTRFMIERYVDLDERWLFDLAKDPEGRKPTVTWQTYNRGGVLYGSYDEMFISLLPLKVENPELKRVLREYFRIRSEKVKVEESITVYKDAAERFGD